MPVTVKFDPTGNSQQAQVIQDATLFSDGVMTAEQVAQLEAAISVSRQLIYASPVAAGTFVKNGPTAGTVEPLLTTDNPLYSIGIAVTGGGTGTIGNVVQTPGQQVTMVIDDVANAVIGTFAYYSSVIDGALSAADNGNAVAGVFQTAGIAGTTADILS